MQVLPGASALSVFKQAKLLASLQAVSPTLLKISACYIHLLDMARPINSSQQPALVSLLDYGEPCKDPEDLEGTCRAECLIVPRLGTISPWSSKATDILRNCGLSQVKRIERGILFRLFFSSPADSTVMNALESRLHDRMTQTVLPGIEQAACIFASSNPKMLKTIDLLGAGDATIS